MIITSTYRRPLGLPSGVVLEPSKPTPVPHWEADQKSAAVRDWVKRGIIKVGDGIESRFTAPTHTHPHQESEHSHPPADDDKEALMAQLDAKGISYDKRWGVKKLREALDA